MSAIRFDFSGRHALVTGGAQGIGFEITKQFLSSECDVTVWDYSSEALKVAERELSAFQGKVSFQQADITNRDQLRSMAMGLQKPIDILVNNAGITRDKSFAKMSDVEFDSVIQTNLTGLYNVTKILLDRFSASGSKRIINMSSVVALYGNFGQTNYVAAKAGVLGLTKTWARELGRKGFTVNAIAPGFIATAMTQAMPPETLKAMSDKVPLARLGTPADIANTCLFLASEGAGYINGATISVDGGLVF
jgi:3-oxoacyl-[acyl-carrier protein] reductase